MSIKAIETRYKGYRFRSRLEARWAVFFDTLGIKWEYEKEGYELPSGWYLPDYWLSDWSCWLEIKPVYPTANEITLAEELSYGTDRPIIVAFGLPLENSLLVFCGDETGGSAGTQWWGKDGDEFPQWSSLACGKGYVIRSGNNHPSREFRNPSLSGHFVGMALDRDCKPKCVRVCLASEAARSTRFEHGESGGFAR